MQRDLVRSRSQSNIKSTNYHETNEDWIMISDPESVTNVDSSQRLKSPHDLRRKSLKKLKDDQTMNSFTLQSSRSANSSPNLNQTQRKKQRNSNSCNIYDNNLKINNSNISNHKTNHDFISRLPDEILLQIFFHLSELELCRLASVSKKFLKISNDTELWKRLYQNVFEYDLPIFKEDNNKFIFVNPNSESHHEIANLWRESFRQFHNSIHIRSTDSTSIAQEILKIKLTNLLSGQSHTKNSIKDNKVPVIFLHKGVYKECLVIDTELSVIGCAPGPADSISKQVIIESSENSTIHFTNGVRQSCVGFMSLLFKPSDNRVPAESDNCKHALLIDRKAKPKIFNCILRSTYDQGSTVYVVNEGTEPTIRNCVIADCMNVGIFVDSYARGFYDNNLIARCSLAGVWVKNMADPIFKKNTIKDGLDAGVFCFDNSQGWFESNDINSNKIANFEVKSNSNPTVIKCKIHHSKTGGIFCHESSRGVFLENKIYSNNFAGIWITSQSSPTIRNCEIYNGLQGGIYLFSGGKGIIEFNNIYGNALAGIQIRTSSDPIIRHNRIHSGMHGGLYFHEKSKGLIENNEIFGNKLAGIWVTTESSPIIRHNRIHSGKQVGVYFYDQGNGVLEENEIFNHLFSGIQIRTNSNPLIKRNKVWSGLNGGILVYNSGQGTIVENEIFDNAMANVWIKTDSNPILRSNKIYEGKDCGVCIFNNGRGILIDNDIFRNQQAGVLISTQSGVELKSNRIHSNHSAGVEITQLAVANLKYNQIFNNKFGGLCIATNAKPSLKSNKIFDNENTIEETIKAGQCLYKISSYTKYPMHDFFRCNTCNTESGLVICSSCKNQCHKDHDVEFIRFDRFFCDCGSGTLKINCKLIETTQETDTLYDSSAPTESKLDQLPVN